MFDYLKEAVNARRAEEKTTTYNFIKNGYMDTWAEENKNNPDRGIERYSTEKQFLAYKEGKKTREQAINTAFKRAEKEIDKRYEQRMQRIEEAERAEDLHKIELLTTWTRSYTWGLNPHTECFVNEYTRTEGKASGCGYDKLSTSCAEALNKNNSVMKKLFTLADEALSKGIVYREFIGYGTGYDILPYFEGGVGFSCFDYIFMKKFNMKRVSMHETKLTDFVVYEMEEEQK